MADAPRLSIFVPSYLLAGTEGSAPAGVRSIAATPAQLASVVRRGEAG
jgi:hypothetical protein